MRLAENDRARKAQPRHDLGVDSRRRDVGARPAVAAGRQPGDVDNVLDADGNAVQRSPDAALPHLVAELLGRGERRLSGDLAPGLNGRLDLAHPVEIARSDEHTSELQSLMRISYAA